MEWIGAVFEALRDCERAEDALRLHELLRASVGAKLDGWIPERHFLLLDVGRKEEALAEAEKLLSERPDSIDAQESALALFQRLGDSARVESLQARIAERNEKIFGPKLASGMFPERPYIAPPKPGRNDPCPCGSGKKYKKCCDGQVFAAPSAAPL